ncbi:hypothetical protein OSL60_27930, partial [Escherichia coli]|nr:hypothetical protein [Escherichia coli]
FIAMPPTPPTPTNATFSLLLGDFDEAMENLGRTNAAAPAVPTLFMNFLLSIFILLVLCNAKRRKTVRPANPVSAQKRAQKRH